MVGSSVTLHEEPPCADPAAPEHHRGGTGRTGTPGACPHHPQRAAKRARVVLLAAEGVPNRQIATLVGMNQHTVSHWRHRFEAERLAGLKDRPRPGRPLVYGHDQRLRILATVTQQPPTRPATGAIPSWPRRWPTSASRPPRSAGSWPTWTSS